MPVIPHFPIFVLKFLACYSCSSFVAQNIVTSIALGASIGCCFHWLVFGCVLAPIGWSPFFHLFVHWCVCGAKESLEELALFVLVESNLARVIVGCVGLGSLPMWRPSLILITFRVFSWTEWDLSVETEREKERRKSEERKFRLATSDRRQCFVYCWIERIFCHQVHNLW